jgi:hypothetical protein
MGGISASIAGAPLAQTKGSEVERVQQEVSTQDRRTENERRAENAAGVGETDGEDHQTGERDADGRRPWQFPRRPGGTDSDGDSPHSKDASGQSGNLLDLCG